MPPRTINVSPIGASSSSISSLVKIHQQYFDQQQNMISDALGVNVSFIEQQYDVDANELPNEETQRFYNLLKETNKLLFDGFSNPKLSMCVRLLGLKSQFHVPNLCLDFMTKMM